MLEEVFSLIANYGFPMVVAGYLLVRLESVIKELQESVSLLALVVARQGGVSFENAQVLSKGASS